MAISLTEYQDFVKDTWIGAAGVEEKELRNLYICTAGLGGETGEVLEKLKKFVRDGNLDVNALNKELGDVLYYLTTIARTFGLTLEDIMEGNVAKLQGRLTSGTMRGSGDDR